MDRGGSGRNSVGAKVLESPRARDSMGPRADHEVPMALTLTDGRLLPKYEVGVGGSGAGAARACTGDCNE